MTTFKEALKTAKSIRDTVDECFEYENGYMFYEKDAEESDGGYGRSPIVVLKKENRAVSMPWFVMQGTGKEIGYVEVPKEA